MKLFGKRTKLSRLKLYIPVELERLLKRKSKISGCSIGMSAGKFTITVPSSKIICEKCRADLGEYDGRYCKYCGSKVLNTT
jgi:rRNA maturation endonuclease Nob1